MTPDQQARRRERALPWRTFVTRHHWQVLARHQGATPTDGDCPTCHTPTGSTTRICTTCLDGYWHDMTAWYLREATNAIRNRPPTLA